MLDGVEGRGGVIFHLAWPKQDKTRSGMKVQMGAVFLGNRWQLGDSTTTSMDDILSRFVECNGFRHRYFWSSLHFHPDGHWSATTGVSQMAIEVDICQAPGQSREMVTPWRDARGGDDKTSWSWSLPSWLPSQLASGIFLRHEIGTENGLPTWLPSPNLNRYLAMCHVLLSQLSRPLKDQKSSWR